jgi:hypothetical protein
MQTLKTQDGRTVDIIENKESEIANPFLERGGRGKSYSAKKFIDELSEQLRYATEAIGEYLYTHEYAPDHYEITLNKDISGKLDVDAVVVKGETAGGNSASVKFVWNKEKGK